jgi:hypothetical protein
MGSATTLARRVHEQADASAGPNRQTLCKPHNPRSVLARPLLEQTECILRTPGVNAKVGRCPP